MPATHKKPGTIFTKPPQAFAGDFYSFITSIIITPDSHELHYAQSADKTGDTNHCVAMPALYLTVTGEKNYE